MPKQTDPTTKGTPAWRADLFALVGYLAEAVEANDGTLTKQRAVLLARHWKRRPCDYRPRPKRAS